MVLELLQRKDFIHSRTAYVLYFNSNKPEVTIGRSKVRDIRIRDRKISRMHSLFIYRNGEMFLKDVGSKIGTFLLLKGKMKLKKS